MSETIKISIRDWMQLPEVLSLEKHYQYQGLITGTWGKFEIVDSEKAYEAYIKDTVTKSIINDTYSLFDRTHSKGKADELLLRAMTATLFALRIAAENTKLEGCPVLEGKLIVQARTVIQIDDSSDAIDGTARRIYWRGAIFKIGDNYELQKLQSIGAGNC